MYEDKPVGYDGARLMIEHELTRAAQDMRHS